MSIITHASLVAVDEASDVLAIAKLHFAFEAQKKAFLADPCPLIHVRRERLQAIVGMMHSYRDRIISAMSADFGHHPEGASELFEVLGMIGRTEDALSQLEDWMKPVPRHGNVHIFGDAKAEIRYQPKGVVGNMAPWNFPFDLTIGPMIDMLAAGNRVILKPSEYTPACADLLAEMIARTFPADLVTVATGGPELARAFTEMRWDHLMYTGSPNVGRLVMQAAARNLVPVTLELGGKCPAILTLGSVDAKAVEQIIGIKFIKNGQMCISVDHVFVPRNEVDQFVDLATDYLRRTVPTYSRSGDCTGIISDRHLDRLVAMLEDARRHGVRVVEPEEGGAVDRATRRMPLAMVVDPPANLQLMQEEIFGPILAIIPYDNLDTVIRTVNAGERPLGIYVFGEDEELIQQVVQRTLSGGVTVNSCAIQGAIPALAFGGVGMSGMGRQHGQEGFREFSNPRGVVTRGTHDNFAVFFPPYQTITPTPSSLHSAL